MMAIGEGLPIAPQLGLEYALILATLMFVAIEKDDSPIAFQLRRHMMPSAPLTEAMNGLADLLFDACQRTARSVGDLAARMTNRNL